MGLDAVLDDTRPVFSATDVFGTAGVGIGEGFSPASAFVVDEAMVDFRRRGTVSPRMKFICSLSSELDSDASSSSSLMLSLMLSGRAIEESPDVDCWRSKLNANSYN